MSTKSLLTRLIIFIISILTVACQNSDKGFVDKFSSITQNLSAGSSNGAKRRYALVSNTHSDSKNISVVSFRLLDVTYSGQVERSIQNDRGLFVRDFKRELNLDITAGSRPVDMDISRDGTKLAVADYGGGAIVIKNISYLRSSVPIGTKPVPDDATTIPIGTGVVDVQFAPDNNVVYALKEFDYGFAIVNIADGTIKQVPLQLKDGTMLRPTRMSLSPDGHYMVVVCPLEKIVAEVDIQKGEEGIVYHHLPYSPTSAEYTKYQRAFIVSTPNHVYMLNSNFMKQEEDAVYHLFYGEEAASENSMIREKNEKRLNVPDFVKSSMGFISAPSVSFSGNIEKMVVSQDGRSICALDYTGNYLIIMENTTTQIDKIDPFKGLDIPLSVPWSEESFQVVAQLALKGKPSDIEIDPLSGEFAFVTIAETNKLEAYTIQGAESTKKASLEMGHIAWDVEIVP